MKILSQELIEELVNTCNKHSDYIDELVKISEDELSSRVNDSSWRVLECIQHLILYGNFYLPEIKNCIIQSERDTEKIFTSGVLGTYFVKMMQNESKKMKTFKTMDPIYNSLGKEVLGIFKNQLKVLLELLNDAKMINLNKNKTHISISKWIKLRLGDTFRIVIYHNERHLKQSAKILNGI